jgi:MinD-like ATPase involved in chromosome partitioning or flagellar assembly
MTLDNVVLPIEILTYSNDEGTVNGRVVTRGTYATIHEACIALTVPFAQQVGAPILTHAVDTIGSPAEYWLHVHPDGRATAASPEPQLTHVAPAPQAAADEPPGQRPGRRPKPADPDVAAKPTDPRPAATAVEPSTAPTPAMLEPKPKPKPEPEPASSWTPPTLDDLLGRRPPPPPGPAQLGWRAGMRRATGGLVTLGPSAAEASHRRAIAAVQRSLSGPKTVVVINPKGGANKTTATLLLAATFGIHRGGYTLAWDNNETRGTMGWRANQGRHTNTAVDLLRELDRFDDARSARVGDLDNFVRNQGSAQFDVLASDENAASAASIDADAFNALHHSLSRFYRMIVVDTGNNMRASNWGAAVAAADQIVIVSTIREDTAQSAAWVADGLGEKGFRDKVANAVTILAAPSLRPDPALTSRLKEHFGLLTRAVVQVPFDPALVSGGPIIVESLSAASREAWLEATAEVADGL